MANEDLTGKLHLGWDGFCSDPREPRVDGIPVRVLKLWAESRGYRLIGPAEAAVLDAAAALPDRELVQVASCPDPRDVGAALARAEVARRTGTTVQDVAASIDRLRTELARRQQPPEKERG
jgi:hypothetical protein